MPAPSTAWNASTASRRTSVGLRLVERRGDQRLRVLSRYFAS